MATLLHTVIEFFSNAPSSWTIDFPTSTCWQKFTRPLGFLDQLFRSVEAKNMGLDAGFTSSPIQYVDNSRRMLLAHSNFGKNYWRYLPPTIFLEFGFLHVMLSRCTLTLTLITPYLLSPNFSALLPCAMILLLSLSFERLRLLCGIVFFNLEVLLGNSSRVPQWALHQLLCTLTSILESTNWTLCHTSVMCFRFTNATSTFALVLGSCLLIHSLNLTMMTRWL